MAHDLGADLDELLRSVVSEACMSATAQSGHAAYRDECLLLAEERMSLQSARC